MRIGSGDRRRGSQAAGMVDVVSGKWEEQGDPGALGPSRWWRSRGRRRVGHRSAHKVARAHRMQGLGAAQGLEAHDERKDWMCAMSRRQRWLQGGRSLLRMRDWSIQRYIHLLYLLARPNALPTILHCILFIAVKVRGVRCGFEVVNVKQVATRPLSNTHEHAGRLGAESASYVREC